MDSNNRCQILSGIGIGFIVWMLFIVADLIDELVLNKGFFIGAFIYVFVPIVLLICYVVNNILYKPTPRKVLIWLSTYCLTFIVLLLIIYILTNSDLLVIQKYRGDSIYLNGMEYIFYGVFAILAFGVLLLTFHLINSIINKRINKR